MPALSSATASVRSYALLGAEVLPVTVEVAVGSGLPGMYIVGLPDTSVQEARQRVKSAVKECGFSIPPSQIVVNLAPARLKKTGAGFDLPIAVALLAATGQIEISWADDAVIVGELSLLGAVRPVAGMLAYALTSRTDGLRLVCAPSADLAGGRGVDTLPLASLEDLKDGARWSNHPSRHVRAQGQPPDFSEIVGEDRAKRALQIAAAGGHGILLMGPPGSGKTMLASRLPTILPPLSSQEQEQTALIHSIAGLDVESIFSGVRPFRSPHHSSTAAGLVGGGSIPHPGEASLAHNGVLFLDEMSEFMPGVLQALRQPCETGIVTLVRAEGCYSFPAKFMLVGAANPCPCGYLGDPEKECTCSAAQISRYSSRIGGPLMDRIDMVVDVWRADPGEVMQTGRGTGSDELKEAVCLAREFSRSRPHGSSRSVRARGLDLIEACGMSESDRQMFEDAARGGQLSGRGIMRTLRVARTIADMEESERVGRDHLLEALSYRVR